MTKVFFFIAVLLDGLFNNVFSIHLNCTYDIAILTGADAVYRCYVENRVDIIKKDFFEITSANGTHKVGKTNEDVTAYYSVGKNIEYFPQGLTKVFVNLKAIDISFDYLRELRQSDMKQYPKLVYLMIYMNPIEIIEAGVFDYNTDLIFIGISYCQLIHIDPKTFDNLVNLEHLWLRGNPCVTKYVDDRKDYVMNLIKLTEEICINYDLKNLYTEIRTLEDNSKKLSCENFTTNLKRFENTFQISNFSNSGFLKKKIANLKNQCVKN